MDCWKATNCYVQTGLHQGRTRDTSRVQNRVQPWRPSHVWAQSIFFRVNPMPFVPAWQLDKSPERSAVQEKPCVSVSVVV